ncbi:hypothetical protein HMPREF3056_08015 [Corynebacterium sp. HMSC056F09]|uniref:DUF2891 family protein n=1 Tax=Corynebacterium sp. HMSC056F09 TaxID=1739548 RepID=UPI0008A43044|nr:DUF2891 family protein [Corynebacterium sp. HMSC056F09]OFO21845.1 hypothetical protein HMPREF3056_08015 [Corynebacterium sp. HMSC056F09]
MTTLENWAKTWAETIVDALEREFPAAMHHTSSSADDCTVRPRELHPSFYGCFDWHSSVHMQYSGALLDTMLGPKSPTSLATLLDDRLSPQALTVEYDYLVEHPGYEMPYGRAWLLQLASIRPSESMDKLVELTAQHCHDWLGSLNQPVRHGMHSNTAFNLFLILEAAEKIGQDSLADSVRDAAVRLFGDDRNYPLEWELSGHDFLSNGLSEALLMSRVLPDFPQWFDGFLPRRTEALDFLTDIPEVLDPTDGRLAHLYGLALTRAWMIVELAEYFGGSALPRAEALVASARPQLVDGHFMSTHWLITYALRYQLAVE